MDEAVPVGQRELNYEQFRDLIQQGWTGEFMLPEHCILCDDIANVHSHIMHYQRIAERVGPEDNVLDVGCGCGFGTRLYRIKTEGRLVAVDRPPAIEIARSLYYTPGVEYFSLDFGEGPLPEGEFDLASFTEVYEHLPEDIGWKVLDEISARLRPEGRLLISVPLISRGQYAENFAYHVRDFEDENSVLREVAGHLKQGQSVCLVTKGAVSDPVMGEREQT